MKNIAFFLCFIASFYNAQYDYFPQEQSPYKEGVANYYKDFHKIVTERNLKPCDNKEEMYNLRVLISPDASIKFVKSPDGEDTLENKCAYDLAREVARYQSGWQPAVITGEKRAAIAHFMIYPDDLFEKYKEGYDVSDAYTFPAYEGSINSFRKKVSENINISRFSWKGKFTIIIRFVVEKDGSVSNVVLDQSSGLKDFDGMVIRTIKNLKNKWTPAKIHSTPVRCNMKLPLSFSME